MRHQGIQRVEWDHCERCGFEYPITMLVMQRGLRVCTKTCFDRTLVEERQLVIGAVLDDESEQQDEKELMATDDDVRFF